MVGPIATVPFNPVLASGSPFSPTLLPGGSGPLSDLSTASLDFLIGTFHVPPFLLPIYQAAGVAYGVPWQALAAINEIETDYGRNVATSSAGAVGWMQFLPSTWRRYGLDADGAGAANPYDPVDAIFAAARLLQAAGAERNLPGAIFAYNHAGWYVNSVLLRAKLLEDLPQGVIDGLTGLMEARFPVAGHLGAFASSDPNPVNLAGAPAVTIAAPAGAPVIAVADGRVLATGTDPRRGRFLVLQDTYGNTFTYSRLGEVQRVYPVLTPRARQVTRIIGAPSPARGSGAVAGVAVGRGPMHASSPSVPTGAPSRRAALPPAAASTPATASLAKERLFGHPSRPSSYAAGGALQLAHAPAPLSSPESGMAALSDYFSQPLELSSHAYSLARLGTGANVVAGTILGHVAPSSKVVLQIRPAGTGAPIIDPRPIIAGWKELGSLIAKPIAPTRTAGLLGAADPSVGALLLESKLDLQRRVLSDPRVNVYACGRTDIQAGLVDRRVLAVIEYLSYSGLAPTISGLVCGQPKASGAPTGERLVISALNGIPVAGHQQDGGVVDLALRRLLVLQGTLRPSRIISLRSNPGQPSMISLPDHAGLVEVDFGTGPPPGRLDAKQWQTLIGRLGQVSAPSVAALGSPAPRPARTGPVGGGLSRRSALAKAAMNVAHASALPTIPGVELVVPVSPLRGVVSPLQAFATAPSGTTIANVAFQYSAAGTGQWQTFDTETSPVSGVEYDATLDTQGLGLQDGHYDFRAIATDESGNPLLTSAVQFGDVSNSHFYVGIASPGSPLSVTATLTATATVGDASPDTASFEACPSSLNCLAGDASWTTFATVGPQLDSNGGPTGAYTTNLDTTTLADGTYDFKVTGQDAASNPFLGGVARDVTIDNTPPTATLANPGGALGGLVTLSASGADAGSGVASIRFESAAAGTDTWSTIGVANTAPYSVSFDTRQLGNGSYDLRAEATDFAGNIGAPSIVRGVSISNATSGAPRFTITRFVAPATKISLLGELPGSDHETWAYGFTNAPPPRVGGFLLPYTAQGNGQLVLLRYTDSTGWRIADVLRNETGGGAYPITPGVSLDVTGQMTASGEAWIAIRPQGGGAAPVAVFHRLPGGGQFTLNSAATRTLTPLLGPSSNGLKPRLIVKETSAGTAYGLLLPAQSPYRFATASSPRGQVSVATQLNYGELANGTWTARNPALPLDYVTEPGSVSLVLATADVTAPGSGWALLKQTANGQDSVILARFDQSGLQFFRRTGLDVLDHTGEFDPGSQDSVANPTPVAASPVAIRADAGGLWFSVGINSANANVVARYDFASGRVVQSWCTGLQKRSFDCSQPLDLDHPASVPDAVFDTADGQVGDSLLQGSDFVAVYAHGTWTSVPTPGFSRSSNSGQQQSLFVDSTDGWLVGPNALGRISPAPEPGPLASWPEANRNPLLSVALPPGSSTTASAGAVAVGVNGAALHYDSAAGWQVDATPPQTRHIALLGVAFAGAAQAFAVGVEGTILRWNGATWSPDPQSVSLTTATLDAVAFGGDGQGWAVGARGTILHYDGTAWSTEQVDALDGGRTISSVAVAGNGAYAIAGGNLIARGPDGAWQRVDPSTLPAPAPPPGSLRLVSGLPDGGLVVAGKSLLMSRSSGSAGFAYAPQTFQGIPVALAAFRDPSGDLRAFVSLAPSVSNSQGQLTDDVGGFPAGDGDLVVQTADGFDDLSRVQYPVSTFAHPGDGLVQPDPVLAVAASPDGSHAWAVGGYSGTHAADGIGTDAILSARPVGWLSSAIWRYDAGGSVQSAAVTQAAVSLPATPGTVSFAYFSSALCKFECAAVENAQPDVNLTTAATQIAGFAGQPGGPSLAILGGNARGPINSFGPVAGAQDMARLPRLLSPLGDLPTYAAFGPLDAVPGNANPDLPWANAFANAPAPFGSAAAPAGITPQGAGDPIGSVNRYYAFNTTQNGGTVRVIVLDNSAGSLESSASGQTAWLTAQLSQATSTGLPIVVIAARPLNSNDPGAASDGDVVAAQLAAAGVLGVFTTSGGQTGGWTNQTDKLVQVPVNAIPGGSRLPEYEGATLTYQQAQNSGVMWYDVSVDTLARKLSVQAIPVIASLALEPLNGLSAARSSTLSFQAIGRRPAATIATTPADPSFPGYDQYVGIPSSTCAGCIGPSYSFKSSDPVVGDFVVPSGPGSPYPKLDSQGKTIPSSTSGLFCAYNTGTTTVSVTSGMLTSSLPVSVAAGGGFGPPCGTVPGGINTNVVGTPGRVIVTPAPNGNPSGAPPPPPTGHVNVVTPKITVPPPPIPVHVPSPVKPVPAHAITKPIPVSPPIPVPIPASVAAAPPVVLPLIPPAVTPVPPGGATASAQASARREEKARRHASQSAYVIRPAGTSADDWFYPAVGVVSVLALLLVAGGLSGPGVGQAALAWARVEPGSRQRRRR